MAFEKIRLEIEDGIALLTLNDPAALNAVSPAMLDELLGAMDMVTADYNAARAFVMTGEGRGFCAGANLAGGSQGEEPRSDRMSRDAGELLETHYHPFLMKLRDLPMPFISAVNGVAAGVGMSFAISADMVIADKSAYFLQAFTRIGLVPDGGSTYLLPRLIGTRRAVELSMLADKLSADTALEWGLINRVVEDGTALKESMAVAARLAKGPTQSYKMARQLYAQTWDNSYAEQLHAERMMQKEAGRTEDCAEGVMAFLEKRPAEFKGK